MKIGKWIAAAALLSIAAAMGADSVEDPYIWLEDVHGAKPLAWVKEQNAHATGVLKSDPDYQKDYDAILKVLDATDRIPYGSVDHQYVFNFWQDATNPKGLWRRTSVADYATPLPHWEVLLDVDKLSADEKENWVWKGADCTPSLKRCLLNLSRGGGDAVVVREFDLATRSFVKDGFALAEAKSSIAWLDDNTVLFGTDFGPGSMTTSGYPRIVKLWKRGTPMTAAKTIYEGKVDDVLTQPVAFHGPGGETAEGSIALVARAISFFETEYYYVRPDGGTLLLPLPLGADIKGATGDALVFTLRDDWTLGDSVYKKGSLILFPLEPFLHMHAFPAIRVLYVPDAQSSIEQVATGRDAVYAAIYRDVIGSIHVYRGAGETRMELPAGGSAGIISANDWGPEAYFSFQNFTTPPTLYFDTGDGHPNPIKSLPARFDAANLVTEQFFATSVDGTRVPYFVTRRKDRSGPQPTVLYGYGGFEISQTPSYSANFGKLWLEKGGAWVVANIRGGGEYGPAWHQAALKANRQRAFDDFAAVAADLERRGITTPKQLGIMGGSNGGLLVSTVMTQHPELLGAVVCQVPLIDMIRYIHIGAGASWEAEYGDPAIPEQRAYILKYSPYQNVRKDKAYPPVLFTTATTDDRVTPVHARKMAARMEEQGHDVLFYENTDGGHGAAADHKQAAEMWALSFVYLKQKLGLK
jgi:prolyl oligopeptidase